MDEQARVVDGEAPLHPNGGSVPEFLYLNSTCNTIPVA